MTEKLPVGLDISSNLPPGEVQPGDSEPLTRQAQHILSKLLDQKDLVVQGVSQAQTEAYFEEVLYPAIIESRDKQVNEGRRRNSHGAKQQTTDDYLGQLRLYVQGHSNEDIAKSTGTTAQTVGSTVSRLLKWLIDSGVREPGYYETEMRRLLPQAYLIEKSKVQPSPRQQRAIGSSVVASTVKTRQHDESEGFILDDTTDDEPEAQITAPGATVDPVKDYLKKIGKTPLLNAQMEVDLSKAIEAGLMADNVLEVFEKEDLSKEEKELKERWLGKVSLEELPEERLEKLLEELKLISMEGHDARQHMLEANLRLVVSIAKRYTGRGMLFLDLISEGNLGLIRAVEKFDYKKGYKFSTYATWWVRQAITRSMADQARTIRVPVHMVEKINQVARIKRQLLQDLDHEPTPEEIAKELDITPEAVIEMEKYARDPISLSTPLGEDGHTEFGELIEDTEALDAHEIFQHGRLREVVDDVLATFSEREAGIIRARFGFNDGVPKTLDEVGEVYGVTRERIRQIQSKTMAKLQHPSRSGRLRQELD